MNSTQEQFLLDVRRAVRLEQTPFVVTDSDLIDPERTARVLKRADLWLTPKVVERYDPAEFPGAQRLTAAVSRFRNVASSVPASEPATEEQLREGLSTFEELRAAVRQFALDEWERAAESLVAQCEQWCMELGWTAQREPREVNETLLGTYSLPQLNVYAHQRLYVLAPIARFVAGGLGAFDLSIQPSVHSAAIFRHDDRTWLILSRSGNAAGTHREALSKSTFKNSVDELRAQAA
jgi:hypothetical protein